MLKDRFSKAIFCVYLSILFAFPVNLLVDEASVVSEPSVESNKSSVEIPKSLLPKFVETLGGANSEYHILEQDGKYMSKTPSHGIITKFHQDQVLFERGEHKIGMRLVSDNENIKPEKVLDNKIEYQRANITEWYVNSPYGVEQGFTVNEKLQGVGNEVSISIALDMSHGATAVEADNGKSVKFVDRDENHILNYNGLYAFDSSGKELPSNLRLKDNNIIEINVDSRGAQYPITIDPFVQSQRVTAADPTSGASDDFGYSVSMDGDRAIVGIPGWDGSAGNNQGAVIIYERNGAGVWVAKPTIFSPSPAASNEFGMAVSISGDWAVVGEPNGDASNPNDGSAHFFQRVSGSWFIRTTVGPINSAADDFGMSVSVSGDRAIVGDPGYGQTTPSFFRVGAVFTYQRSGNSWVPLGFSPIVASDGQSNAEFGSSVSISGNWFIAGARLDNDGGGISGIFTGAVYFFERLSNGTLLQRQKVIGLVDSELGASVFMSGDRAVAGAPGEESTISFGVSAGSVYVFERSGLVWGTGGPDVTTETKIFASNQRFRDEFGTSVYLSGDRIVVGSPRQDTFNSDDGSVYIYERISPGVWGNEEEIIASDPVDFAFFGDAVAITGDTVLVGAPQADETSPVFRDQQGAAYFYDLEAPNAMLTIVKETNPNGATGFGFFGTGFPSTCGLNGPFTLDDNDSAGTSFIDCDLVAGSYTVQENNPNGFTLVDINCTGTTNFTETADSVTVNLAANDSVVCRFENTINRNLTVTVNGSGTVTSSPVGINCGSDCTEDYVNGTVVTLTPTPVAGFTFVGWTGAEDCSDGSLTLNRNRSCTATFEQRNTLTVTKAGDGDGTVTSSPAGIDCGSDCTEDFETGTAITLTPIADPDSDFRRFEDISGASCVSGSFTLNQDTTCRARFDRKHTLQILKTGTGTGTVTSSPAGINCGATCNALLRSGATIVLTAVADANSTFIGFTTDSGASCTSGSFTLNQDSVCTATFDLKPTLTVTKTGTGTITSSPVGINCGSDCTEAFDPDTVVTLTASNPGGSNELSTWGGACSSAGSNPTATVTMSASQTCSAAFTPVQRTLNVNNAGDGAGTVTSAPAGINCGSDCTEVYNHGTVVTLTAAPQANSVFAGFTGTGCTTGTVTLNSDRTCTATFDLANRTLTTTVNGGGTITSSPAGINCGSDCTEDYDVGTVVTLTPTPDSGFRFDRWNLTGDCSDGVVTMNDDRNCNAHFVRVFPLTVNVIGPGTVTSAPAGINCGSDCTEDYDNGTVITLTPVPNSDAVFVGFTGAGCTTGTVTLNAAATCTATFDLADRTLTTTVNGGGTMTSNPAGINCGSDCTEDYDVGTAVTLTATPDTNYEINAWGGACSAAGNNPTANITMSTEQNCTVTFSLIQRTLTLNKTGIGTGTVTSSPAGINCGADCTEDYDHGTVVALTSVPDADSVFEGFTGAGCTTGTVTLNGAATCTATFNLKPTLVIAKTGTGTGTVTTAPAGINCGATCSADFNPGASVVMTATPSVNSVFVGFTGAGCTTGTVNLNSDTTCTAEFALEQRTLNLNKTGTGTGTVTSSPAGIDCGADCTENYDHGSVITLNPDPNADSLFVGFVEAACATGTVSLDTNTTCTAVFDIKRTLSIEKRGRGEGRVVTAPGGIDCGDTCDSPFSLGSSIDIIAVPDPGSVFASFRGDGCTTGTVILNEDTTCTVEFAFEMQTLNVLKAGAGTGTVTSSPGGIDCGADCMEVYDYGTVITLNAVADAGSVFVGFDGIGCASGTLALNDTTTCTALFDVDTNPPPSRFPVLTDMDPGNPGLNTLTSTNHIPGGEVTFIYGFNEGVSNADGICLGLELGVIAHRILQTTTADQFGTATIDIDVPPSAVGVTVKFQSVDESLCTSSNIITQTIDPVDPGGVEVPVLSTLVPGTVGPNTLTSTNHTPGGEVTFVYGFNEEPSNAGDICSGLQFGIKNHRFLSTAVADQFGNVTINVNVPPSAEGITVKLQSVDVSSCIPGNIVTQTL